MIQSDPAPGAVNELADRFWERLLELSPTTATLYGDERYDDRLEDPGPAGRAAARALFERTLADAEAIPPDGLSIEDRITRDMLGVVCRIHLEQDDQRIDLLRVVDHMGGPQLLLLQNAQFQKADTPERLERLIGRLAAYPAYMAANIELLREGRERNLTAARITAERTVAQLERILQIPAESSGIVTTPAVANEADRARIADAVRTHVEPSDQAFLAALKDGYVEASRSDLGLWSAPNGGALYRTQIRAWTTLDFEPQELHDIGLAELGEIDEARRDIALRNGFGADVAALRAAFAQDSGNLPADREALLARAREDTERAMAIAPRYFGRLPRAACLVMAVEDYKEADAPPAYYYPPSADGSRPGIYYVNTVDLPTRTFMKLASTTYHEAVPGHHFQIAIEMELEGLPRFRTLGSRLVGMAYPEGWGLYSERLADEMGLYRNDAERLGMLDAQAWRAARLVVDTGLHALRWSRQDAIDTLINAAALSTTDATIETDRYITWPGQALTYKVGQREIERLRREIEQRDGPAFDIRAFHDEVLGHGALPLATLTRELPGWVRTPA